MARRTSRVRKDLKAIVYPYLFVLSEGKMIEENPLDFRLMMFHSSSQEVLPSPHSPKKIEASSGLNY